MASALVQGAGWETTASSADDTWFPELGISFGGGFGGTHRLACGALSGALLALGALYAQGQLSRDATYQLAAQLLHDFEQEFGTLLCWQLVGLDPDLPGWREAYQARQAHTEICWPCVEFASRRCWELVQNSCPAL